MLNLAVDREIITQKVLKFGDPPAYALVPPNVANFPGGAQMDFAAAPYAARLQKAQALMAQLGFGPGNHFHTTYQTPSTPYCSPHRCGVAGDAAANLCRHRHRRGRRERPLPRVAAGQFDLASASWFADFNDASNFLDLLRHDSGNNASKYDNPKFDTTLDAAQRLAALLLAAEKIALKDYPWIPLRYRLTEDLMSLMSKVGSRTTANSTPRAGSGSRESRRLTERPPGACQIHPTRCIFLRT